MNLAVAKHAIKLLPTYANVAYVVFRQVLNPGDIRPMFRLRDLIDLPGFRLVMDKVRADHDTAANIRDRYISGPHDLDALARHPEGTLGYAHAKFMKHFSIPVVFYPDELQKELDAGRIDDIGYLRMRARETHDVWHTVLGIPPDGFGEMEIATVYLRQMNLPLSGILLAIGFLFMTLRMPHGMEGMVDSVIKGWNLGTRAKPLIGMRWEEMWERPLADVRKELGLHVLREAWDVPSMDELAKESLDRFAAYAKGDAPNGPASTVRERFESAA